MACKCGSRRKAGSEPFVVILAKELERNVKRTLSGLASSPIFIETSEQFCAVPSFRWHQFNFLGFIPFNSLIDKKWAERCECIPEKGTWEVRVFWEADAYDDNGNLGARIRDTVSTFYTNEQPRGAAAVLIPVSNGRFDWRVVVAPPGVAPYFLGDLIAGVGPNFQMFLGAIQIKFLANGCFPQLPPPTPPFGNYPGLPSPPTVIPTLDIFIPPDPPDPPPKPKIPPIPIPRKPDECCDCC